jgi:predicted branched-subunit amino acid permease
MKEEIKRYLISFGVTFVAMFLIFLYPSIESGNWEANILLSAILAAGRSAFKFAWEMFILPLLTKLIDWAKAYIKKNEA